MKNPQIQNTKASEKKNGRLATMVDQYETNLLTNIWLSIK